MRVKTSSILKLVFSLGLGFLLIWLVFKNLSKPNDILAPVSVTGEPYTFLQWAPSEENYYKVGDTIALLEQGGEVVQLVSSNEGYLFETFVEPQGLVQSGQSIGRVKLKVFEVITSAFVSANYWWIAIAIIGSLLSHISRSIRWRMLLNTLGQKPAFDNTVYAVGSMYLGNLAFPRLGEVLRCSILARYEQIPINKSIGTMITERIIDLLSLGVLMLFTLLTQYKVFRDYFEINILPALSSSSGGGSLKFIILGALAFIAAVVFLLIRAGKIKIQDRLRRIVRGLVEGLKSVRYVKSPGLFIFHSVVIWILYLVTIGACIYAVPETRHLPMLSSLPLLFFGAFAIIFVQGGVGLYPLIISQVLLLYGVASSTGYAVGWLAWTVQTILIVVFGLISLVLLNIQNRKPEPAV